MKRKLKILAIGAIAFALFLLGRIPASVAFDHLLPGQVVATNVSGTIWHGSAAGLALDGMRLGETTWRLQLSSLLRAELAYAFSTRIGGQALTGTAASRSSGTITLRKITGRIPLSELSAYLPTGFLTGTAEIDAESVRIEDGWPSAIDGRFVVSDLSALTTRPPTNFGDFEAIFDQQSDMPLTGSLNDLSGPIELSGQVTLASDRSFDLNATVAAKPDATPQISNMLNFVGPADGQGRRQLSYSGRL